MLRSALLARLLLGDWHGLYSLGVLFMGVRGMSGLIRGQRLVVDLGRAPSAQSWHLLCTRTLLHQMLLVIEFEVLLQLLILNFVPMQIDLTLGGLSWLELGEDLGEQLLLLKHFFDHVINVLLSTLKRLLCFLMVLVQRLHLSVERLDHLQLFLFLPQ